MEHEKLTVEILLNEDSEEVNLRNANKFNTEEIKRFKSVFGESWLDKHSVTKNDSKFTLDLSAYDLDPEDLPYFEEIYNNPLDVQTMIENKVKSFKDLRRFTKITKAFNITSFNLMLNNARDILSAENRILILLNLNGTLVCRETQPIDTHRPYDLQVRHSYFYLRPNYNIFLRRILEHPRSLVAICSSMVLKNIVPVRSLLLHDADLKKVEGKLLEKMFDRSYTIKNPTMEDPHNTLRDLDKVWKTPELKARFGPVNTLLLESDSAKGERYKGNMFVLFPYGGLSVKHNMPNNSYYMNAVADYIVHLLDNADDVPEYLMMNSFKYDDDIFKKEDEEFKKVLEQRMAKLQKKQPKIEHKTEETTERKKESPKPQKPTTDEELEENVKKIEEMDI